MDISLIARLKSKEDFFDNYKKGDHERLFDGKSLLFYAISNNNLEARYEIVDFLLNEGAKVDVVNEHQETLLHILLSSVKHDLTKTIALCKRLIENGCNINQLDDKNRLALLYLVNMKYSDEELEPLYNIWLSQPNVIVNIKNKWDKTPLDVAKTMPYRSKLVGRLQEYEK